jgi:hypothetical protein
MGRENMIGRLFTAIIAIIIVIIGESVIIEIVNSLHYTGFFKVIFILALPIAAILGLIALFRNINS